MHNRLILYLVKTMKNFDDQEAEKAMNRIKCLELNKQITFPRHWLTIFSGSVKADSVTLALKLNKTNFTVEARICGQDWYSASVSVIKSDDADNVRKVKVQSLSPYTCYEFLVVQWEGGGGGGEGGEGWCPLKSPVSQPVRTEGSGLPSSPPVMTAIRQLPRLNINITFSKPAAPNGRM